MIRKLHVYWGDGKGKTTAAMGLALRCLGHGKRVLIAQFMKNGNSGELKALAAFPEATVMTAPPMAGFTFQMNEGETQSAQAQQTAFAEEARQTIREARPFLIILDELGIALATDLVQEDVGRALIREAMACGETAVTGYCVPQWLIDEADYASHVVMQRHPFVTEGLPAREGIEW